MSDSHLNLRQHAGVEVVRAGKALENSPRSVLPLRGQFRVQHWRNGQRIGEYVFPNGITDEGVHKLFDVMFNSDTPIATWHLGLIDNANYSALSDADTYDNIDQAGNGWDEFKDYTDTNNGNNATTRPVWLSDAATTRAVTNSTAAIFKITQAGTVKGVFVVGGGDADTKGDHAPGGVLWATAFFTVGDVAVNANDQLKVSYGAAG